MEKDIFGNDLSMNKFSPIREEMFRIFRKMLSYKGWNCIPITATICYNGSQCFNESKTVHSEEEGNRIFEEIIKSVENEVNSFSKFNAGASIELSISCYTDGREFNSINRDFTIEL